MPLDPSSLETDILAFINSPPGDPPGSNSVDCASAWASAFGSYLVGVTPPSTTVAAAQSALEASLVAAFASPSGLAAMDAAFTAAAAIIGIGMAPAYAAVPPVAPIDWATVLAAPYAESNDEAASQIATAIHTSILTGVSTLVAPPFTVVPWS